MAYRHGLRASEVVVLRWDDIDLTTGRLHVRRAKGGDPACIQYQPGKVEHCASSYAKPTKVTVASLLSCREAGKARIYVHGSHLGNLG